MGDMREYYEDMKEIYRQRKADRNAKFEPQLIALGAILKSEAVYELNGWLCYPTKGFAMNKRNTKQRMQLQKFIDKETSCKYN